MARASTGAAAAVLPQVRPFVPAVAIVALQLVVFPAGIGPWSLGVVSGLLTALVALGLALIYRANRILNFSQGDLGTVPTTVAVGLVAVSGLPWLVGAFLGLGVVVLLVVTNSSRRSPTWTELGTTRLGADVFA